LTLAADLSILKKSIPAGARQGVEQLTLAHAARLATPHGVHVVVESSAMVQRASCHQLCALIALSWLAPGMLGCRRPPGGEPSAANRPAAPRQIVALGRLEPAGGVLSISAIPGERLKDFAEGVEEGKTVPAGAELGRVASYNLRATQLEAVNVKLRLGREKREQELAVAEAQLEQAMAAKAEVDAKLEEILAQAAVLDSANEAVAIAEADYQKLVELRTADPELVTEHQMRRRRHQADQAAKEFEVRARTHAAALRAAQAAVAAAAKNVRLAELNRDLANRIDANIATEMEQKIAAETLEQSILRAPRTEGGSKEFTVLKILMEPGEFVTQIPILQIGDTSSMVCIAEVYEADAKEIASGQKATIYSPALSGKFADGEPAAATGRGAGGIAGEVVRVGTLVSSAELTNRNPLAPSDRSIVEVLIAIDPTDEEATAEAARHIGLQVTVQFGEKPPQAMRVPNP
jgi:HlyD family secretion protein